MLALTDSPGKSGKAKRAEAALEERARQQKAPMAVASLANESSWSLSAWSLAGTKSSSVGEKTVADDSDSFCCAWPCFMGRRYEMVEPAQEVLPSGADGRRMK